MTIVECEFEGGPLGGHRVTAAASREDLPVVLDEDGRPRIAWGTTDGASIGVYRYTRQYDCAHTFECVYVFRWVDQSR